MLCVLIAAPLSGVATTPVRAAGSYTNPLPLLNGAQRFESCPDPAVIRGQTPGDTDWYLYCTTDPPDSASRSASRANGVARSEYDFHFVPIFRSPDLINWSYAGDLFAARPAWIALTGYAWAPEVQYFNNRYYLYYTGSETTLPGGGSAIFVATSASPTGPWTANGTPVVAPQDAACCAGSRRWMYDPAVIADDAGQRYLFFGSYFGGISARRLSADGLIADPASETPIAIPNRYEGAAVVRHGGYYYLFVSATNCCNGPLTGYSVFVGRASSVLGPYTDRDGVSLLAGRVGGAPALSMNGNRWVGPGHAAIFTDFAGQDWMLYHAVDRNDPFFAPTPGFTKRPALLDPLDWYGAWPTVRGGQWASDTPEPGPAAQPGERAAYMPPRQPADEALGSLVAGASDEFAPATAPGPQWQWVRPPASGTYGLTDGTLRFATQAAELDQDTNTASVLTESAPAGEYTVETRVRLDLPPEGCCQNYVQAGLVIYRDDDNYLKLTHASIFETRQIEFAKELNPVPPGYPRYGNTVLGPPTDWTYLRIAKRIRGTEEEYTAYASRDGQQWTRGGTWTDTLGSGARIGLVAFGGAGFTANFDYVHVYAAAAVSPLPAPRPPAPASTPPGRPTPNPLPPAR
jgi:arabinan endo-1,5-alpha-L-arabinosidase